MDEFIEDYDNNDNQNNQTVSSHDEDDLYMTIPVPIKCIRYDEKRKFRRQWSEKYFWVENRNGRAFCSACEKFIINNLTHITKHGQNISHRKRIKDQMNQLSSESFEEVNSENDEIVEIKIEKLTNDEMIQLQMATNSLNKQPAQTTDKIFIKDQMESDKVVEVWTMKLQKMDPTQKIIAEHFINEILFEGQMGTLHRNAMQLHIVERIYDPDDT